MAAPPGHEVPGLEAAPGEPGFKPHSWGAAHSPATSSPGVRRRSRPIRTVLDFNPGRGILYFFLGWIIFPIMIGVEAVSGADFSSSRMLLGTLAMSVLVGIVGTFTENVGV